MKRSNPATLEKGDLFVGTFDSFEFTRSGYQISIIDNYPFITTFDLLRPPAGAKNWKDARGKLVVFEYLGPSDRSSRPRVEIRVVVRPNEARSYGRWGGREQEQFDIERRGGRTIASRHEQLLRDLDDEIREERMEDRLKNPALPPFEPVEVEQIRADMQAAIGAVAERYGLRVQYSELAPNEKVIPIGFKITRRAPEQKDLFGNPSRESNPRQGRIGRRISST